MAVLKIPYFEKQNLTNWSTTPIGVQFEKKIPKMYSNSEFAELCKEIISKNDNVDKDQLFVDTLCVNPKSAIAWIYFQPNLSDIGINYKECPHNYQIHFKLIDTLKRM